MGLRLARACAAAWCLWLVVADFSVHAQARGYEELIAEAISEFNRGHWNESRSLFDDAHTLKPSARTRRGLGMVEFELRHYVQSVRLLRAALQDKVNPLPPALVETTEALANRAQRFVGRYRLELDPSAAGVTVDDAAATLESDGSLLLDAGEHRVVATLPGYEQSARIIDARGGDDKKIQIALRDVSATPTQAVVAPTEVALPTPTANKQLMSAIVSPSRDSDISAQWWFWTAAGALVVAATVGIIAGVSSDGGSGVRDAIPGSTGVMFTVGGN